MNTYSENRIDKTFVKLREKKEKCLIIYFTGGDPDIETTLKILNKLSESGADIIEIGVPFSDPMGDGKANQKAAQRALKSNTTLKDIFSCVKKFRKKNKTTPIVLFSYLNPVYAYGYKKFSEDCKKYGIDGCLFVDMPYDAEPQLQKALKEKGIHIIFLATPATEEKRIKQISKKVGGFLYAVSSFGVTGERKKFEKGFENYIKKLKKFCPKPVCVGFGISNAEMAKKAAKYSDGAIIGSAVVNIIEKYSKNKNKMLKEIESFVKNIKKSLLEIQ